MVPSVRLCVNSYVRDTAKGSSAFGALAGVWGAAEPPSWGPWWAVGIHSGPNLCPDRRPRQRGHPGGQRQKYLNGLGQRV